MIPQSISQIGGFTALAFGVDTPDWLAIDPNRCTDCDDAPIRTTIEAAPGEDGALILPALDDAWIITLAGDLMVTSTGNSSESGYLAAVDDLFQSLKTAINALKAAPDDLVHSGGTLKVWKQAPLELSWANYWQASVTFGLVVDVFAT